MAIEKALVTRETPSMMITPAGSISDAIHQFKLYQELKTKLATDEDFQPISGKKHPKKSFVRKVQRFFNLSCELLRDEPLRNEDGKIIAWLATARAIHIPTGAYQDADGSCSFEEKVERQRTIHNIRAHAITRAKNRAILDLVGFGEVSAEEIQGDEFESNHPNGQPKQQQPKPVQPAAENSNPVAVSSELTIQDPEAKATPAHYKALYAKADEHKVNLKKLAKELFGDESLKSLKQGQIKALYDAMQNGSLNWTSFWTKVKSELGYKENEVREIAGAYFEQEVKSLTDVIKTQEALDQFLDYLQNLAKEETAESELPWQ